MILLFVILDSITLNSILFMYRCTSLNIVIAIFNNFCVSVSKCFGVDLQDFNEEQFLSSGRIFTNGELVVVKTLRRLYKSFLINLLVIIYTIYNNYV